VSTSEVSGKPAKADKRGFFGAIALFVRQCVAELKKVVWPTKKDMSTYGVVVLVFVLLIMAFVFLVDIGIKWGVGQIF
jgi:preprotein translocase subunit SecE